MSSTAKTPNIGLNQWEATDAPLRVDFNEDNRLVDAAIRDDRQRMNDMTGNLEEVNHSLYRLYLQQYYEYKDVPRRATLFFDAFRDTSMMDISSTAYIDIGNQCICNWDKDSVTGNASTYNANVQLGGWGSDRISGISNAYSFAGPFRIVRMNFSYIPSYFTTSRNIDLAVYNTNANGLPTSNRQVLRTVTQSVTGGGSVTQIAYEPAQPFVTATGNFAIAWESDTLGTGGGTEYWQLGQSFSGALRTLHRRPAGGAYQSFTLPGGYRMAVELYGSCLQDPPRWVTREVVLSRPCAQATVYTTQNTASVGRLVPRVALYNAGNTPVYANMTRDASKDLVLSGGRTETCYTFTQADRRTHVRLSFQFSGQNIDDKIYEYGCVMSE